MQNRNISKIIVWLVGALVVIRECATNAGPSATSSDLLLTAVGSLTIYSLIALFIYKFKFTR